jgi:Ca2+-binding EF-hand superfamily protein
LSLRGNMNNFRRALVEQAFDIIDADKSGDLTIADLKGVYNASQHPEVKAGRKTEDAVLTEFLHTFESMYDYYRIDDDKVTKDEFIEYYNFVSASIDHDQYFELMMNNAWRMNEGANKRWNDKGWGSQYDKPGSQQQQQGGKGRVREEFGLKPRQGGEVPRTNFPGAQNDAQKGIEKIRQRLNQRGARGFIGLQRQFKIMDDDNDKGISYREFTKALKDYKIDLNDDESRAVFREFDSDQSGILSIDEFVRGVRGEMNDFRRGLITQAFGILDKDRDGVLRINDIKGVYSARLHPDVKSGKRTEDEVLGEFLETFEAHHNLRAGGHRDQNVTLNEFIEYYNNVGANIDDDKYFEHMIVTSYKLYAGDQKFKDYAPSNFGQQKPNWTQEYQSGKVSNYAPFGTSNEPTNYSTYGRPQTAQSQSQTSSRPQTSAGEQVKRSAYTPQGFGEKQTQPTTQSKPTDDYLFRIFRDKVASRGTRGILGLARLFKIIDDDNSKELNQAEFTKVLKDLRLDFGPQEVKRLFELFDTNRNGMISYDEFLRGVRGPMSENRVNVIKLAFKKLDADNSGIITLDDLRGRYNPKNHPDVKSGKKTEDEVLAEFLDTFEQHHAVHTGDFKGRNAQVTFEEFTEYYNNISCSIDDDRYFEQMIRTAWNLDNASGYQKGWRGDR